MWPSHPRPPTPDHLRPLLILFHSPAPAKSANSGTSLLSVQTGYTTQGLSRLWAATPHHSVAISLPPTTPTYLVLIQSSRGGTRSLQLSSGVLLVVSREEREKSTHIISGYALLLIRPVQATPGSQPNPLSIMLSDASSLLLGHLFLPRQFTGLSSPASSKPMPYFCNRNTLS